MCLITLCPPNVEIPREGIEQGACSNPDGHGWAVASEEFGLVVGKSMKEEVAIEDFLKERARQGEHSVALFHSRLGTHGSKNLANTHPFYIHDVSGQNKHRATVMVHNGVMPSLWHPDVKDDRSDTRVFGDETAAYYLTERGVPSRRGASILGKMIGSGNKLVFLSTRQPGRPFVRIVNAGSGMWEDGVWYSNDWWKRKRYTAPTTSYNQGRDCAEEKCRSKVYMTGETKCHQHRTPKPLSPPTGQPANPQPAAPKATPVTTSSVPVKGGEEKTSSPQQNWNGYGIYGGAGGDDSSLTDQPSLLDKIEETLGGGGDESDISPTRICEVCRTRGVIHIPTNVCTNCHWCLDCYVSFTECKCFDFERWLRERDGEADELADALAREAALDAIADEAKAADEKAEEDWLAGAIDFDDCSEESAAKIAEFYGVPIEEARSVLGRAADRKKIVDKAKAKAKPVATGR